MGWAGGVVLVYGGWGGDSWKQFSALAGSKVANVLASLKIASNCVPKVKYDNSYKVPNTFLMVQVSLSTFFSPSRSPLPPPWLQVDTTNCAQGDKVVVSSPPPLPIDIAEEEEEEEEKHI